MNTPNPTPEQAVLTAALAEADHIAEIKASGFGIIQTSIVPYHLPVLAAEVRRLQAALAEKDSQLKDWQTLCAWGASKP